MEKEIQFIIKNVQKNKLDPKLHHISQSEYGFVYRLSIAEYQIKDICEEYIKYPFKRDETLYKLNVYGEILLETKDRHYEIYKQYKANQYNTSEFYNKLQKFYEYMNNNTDDFKLLFENEEDFMITYLKDLEILLFLEPDVQKARDVMEFIQAISEAMENEYN